MKSHGIIKLVAVITLTLVVEVRTTSYDFYIFALTTRGGFCSNATFACRPWNTEVKYQQWTIHGLWPSFRKVPASGPLNCAGEFKADEIKSILEDLNMLWPNYRNERNEIFWKHEYEKHGTCMVARQNDIKNSLDYFKKNLNLLKTYNVAKWLSGDGIKPNNQTRVSLATLYSAIGKNFNGNVFLNCQDSAHGHTAIQEIQLCLDLDYNPTRDCPIPAATCDENVFYLWNSASVGISNILLVTTAVLVALLIDRKV